MKRLTIKELRDILDSIVDVPVPSENLEEMTLGQDLRMNATDVTDLSMKIEQFLGIPIPDRVWCDWAYRLFSLTVKQVISDCNALEQ